MIEPVENTQETTVRRRRMLSGPPAYALIWVMLAAVLVSVVGFPVWWVLVQIEMAGGGPGPAANSPEVMIYITLPMVISYGLFELRSRMERDARYTTNPFRDEHVDLCDWKTGVVLREAGLPLLGWRGFRVGRARARDLHRAAGRPGPAVL